ncbi:MAG TPA: peptide chain release factor N(5)-glutamine methyltransferase [Flavipsychrobacter sp.]|nr:peptide chain release factor N(5)-glutamine methyltransferase [Flavipsychrobacter sp.]
MPSYQQAFQYLRKDLATIYDANEAVAIAHELLEYLTGLGKLERLMEKSSLLSNEQEANLENAILRLMQGEPLQYITEQQWFLGNPYRVNKHVLIPRPETEELVQWIVADWNNKGSLSILEVGTGSGCISIALKMQLPNATITSCDISENALYIARENAQRFQKEINFIALDFLDSESRSQLNHYDVIVSNPPYIPLSEKEKLDKNVKDFEPALALFVPNDDALIFYREIAFFGKTNLLPRGAIYCELHQDYATETLRLFKEMNYEDVELRKDVHNNNRMLKARSEASVVSFI